MIQITEESPTIHHWRHRCFSLKILLSHSARTDCATLYEFSQRLILADTMQPQLTNVISQIPEAAQHSSILLRTPDCYGLFQGLISKLTKIAA
jgi:hypothetical protein